MRLKGIFEGPLAACGVVLLAALLTDTTTRRANAEWTRTFQASRDNTLFEYDPADPHSLFHSNGWGNFFAAGRTYSKSQIQRGLIQFNVDVPADAVVTAVSLSLRLVDVPRNDDTPRPFWLVALTGPDQAWGEGSSEANIDGTTGAGSGAKATDGDATWFHTQYDSQTHDQVTFDPAGPGFWSEKGALGPDPFVPSGPDVGLVNGVLYGDERDFVTWSTDRMVADVQGWVSDPATNFGWIVLGDELVDDAKASTKRGFASRQHANQAWRPVLTVQYTQVPEPSTWWLGLVAAGLAAAWRRGRRRPRRPNDRQRTGPAGEDWGATRVAERVTPARRTGPVLA